MRKMDNSKKTSQTVGRLVPSTGISLIPQWNWQRKFGTS